MNAQALRNTAVSNTTLSGLFTRRAIWTNREGAIVSPVNARVPNLPLTSVSWEAYVVQSETTEAMPNYPKLEDTNSFQVANGVRPVEEIRSVYMARVRPLLSDEDYKELTEKLTNNELVIAVTIHQTRLM